MTRAALASVLVTATVVFSACGYGHSMSAVEVARYFERTTPMRDVVCTTTDTNGWKYSCSFVNQSGTRAKIGVNVHGSVPRGSPGAVPASSSLPPPPPGF
jgi:hypothetical protein